MTVGFITLIGLLSRLLGLFNMNTFQMRVAKYWNRISADVDKFKIKIIRKNVLK